MIGFQLSGYVAINLDFSACLLIVESTCGTIAFVTDAIEGPLRELVATQAELIAGQAEQIRLEAEQFAPKPSQIQYMGPLQCNGSRRQAPGSRFHCSLSHAVCGAAGAGDPGVGH